VTRHEIVTGYGPGVWCDAREEVYATARDWCLPGVTVTPGHGFAPAWGSEPVLVITVLLDGDPALSMLRATQFAQALRECFLQDAVLHTWHEVQGGLL
jgi:hypothetical protein